MRCCVWVGGGALLLVGDEITWRKDDGVGVSGIDEVEYIDSNTKDIIASTATTLWRDMLGSNVNSFFILWHNINKNPLPMNVAAIIFNVLWMDSNLLLRLPCMIGDNIWNMHWLRYDTTPSARNIITPIVMNTECITRRVIFPKYENKKTSRSKQTTSKMTWNNVSVLIS